MDVRQSAATCLSHVGPQGVLLLVEGIQHDASPLVRAACAKGLSSPVLGARAARVLLLALLDPNQEVRVCSLPCSRRVCSVV